MREIKFRAWDKSAKEMIEVKRLALSDNMGWCRCAYCGLHIALAETDYNLLQYTGLKDKNGTEAYDSDVTTGGGLVCWDEQRGLWVVEKDGQSLSLAFRLNTIGDVVIGNIYEKEDKDAAES